MKFLQKITVVAAASAVLSTQTFASEPEVTIVPVSGTILDAGGYAGFRGEIGANFNGLEGLNEVNKAGWSNTDIAGNVGGDLCGPTCADGAVYINAAAGEDMNTSGYVVGGAAAAQDNYGVAGAGAGIRVGGDMAEINVGAGFAGNSMGEGAGDSVESYGEQAGGANVYTTISYGGDACGIDCGAGTQYAEGSAWQSTNMSVVASGSTAGVPVGAINSGSSSANLAISVAKTE